MKPAAPPVTEDLKEDLRRILKEALPDVTFSFEPGDIISQVMSFGSPTPIEVAVQGPALAASREFAEKLRIEMEKVPFLRDLHYAQPLDYPAVQVSIDRDRAGQFGITTADVVKLWPKAEEFGFANEEAAFALQYGHGVGLSIWEKPIFSRLVSLDHPEVIEEGMVFALETYWPASDGWSAARLEEEVVVTKDGCEIITRFPSEKLLVAGTHYFTSGGELSTTRETQSNLNNPGALDRIKR